MYTACITKILVGAAAVAVVAAPAAASANEPSFQADVTATVPLPAPCSNGAFFCGRAQIPGYGTARWDYQDFNLTPSHASCGNTYTATTDFTLASDGSTLALNESGYICSPGKDAASFFAESNPNAYGHPSTLHGTWTVDTADSTGQFAGLGGSGTDDLKTAGAHVSGSYAGALGS